MDQLHQALNESLAFWAMTKSIRTNPTSYSDYKIHNELILCKGSIWLDPANSFTWVLLVEFHSTPLGDHLGVAKTFIACSPILYGII